MDVRVMKKNEGEIWLEGDECTQVYFKTDKIIFSISTLLPGQKACIDKGHKESHEICYVISGSVVMHLPKNNKNYILNTGDAILIPEGEPHYSVNIGEKKSITAWACAPKL
jgi:oxalate decarboxylase/phosphoglucose isomerase-like protein (cupin superfamily)